MKNSKRYFNKSPSVPLFKSQNHGSRKTLARSVSEHMLQGISVVADKIAHPKTTTTAYFARYSSMAVFNKQSDLNNDEEDIESDVMDRTGELTSRRKIRQEIVTSSMGLFLNLFLTFLYQANQYVVAPTSGKYASILGMSDGMSGAIIGMTPFAAIISALILSLWSNYSYKQPLLTCLFMLTSGNLIYGMALQCNSTIMIFVGRLLTGLGAPRGVTRRYIADHVSLKDRLSASSHFITAGAMGLTCGPLVSSLMSTKYTAFTLSLGSTPLIIFNDVTAPGWIMATLFGTCFILFLFYFEEPQLLYNHPPIHRNITPFSPAHSPNRPTYYINKPTNIFETCYYQIKLFLYSVYNCTIFSSCMDCYRYYKYKHNGYKHLDSEENMSAHYEVIGVDDVDLSYKHGHSRSHLFQDNVTNNHINGMNHHIDDEYEEKKGDSYTYGIKDNSTNHTTTTTTATTSHSNTNSNTTNSSSSNSNNSSNSNDRNKDNQLQLIHESTSLNLFDRAKKFYTTNLFPHTSLSTVQENELTSPFMSPNMKSIDKIMNTRDSIYTKRNYQAANTTTNNNTNYNDRNNSNSNSNSNNSRREKNFSLFNDMMSKNANAIKRQNLDKLWTADNSRKNSWTSIPKPVFDPSLGIYKSPRHSLIATVNAHNIHVDSITTQNEEMNTTNIIATNISISPKTTLSNVQLINNNMIYMPNTDDLILSKIKDKELSVSPILCSYTTDDLDLSTCPVIFTKRDKYSISPRLAVASSPNIMHEYYTAISDMNKKDDIMESKVNNTNEIQTEVPFSLQPTDMTYDNVDTNNTHNTDRNQPLHHSNKRNTLYESGKTVHSTTSTISNVSTPPASQINPLHHSTKSQNSTSTPFKLFPSINDDTRNIHVDIPPTQTPNYSSTTTPSLNTPTTCIIKEDIKDTNQNTAHTQISGTSGQNSYKTSSSQQQPTHSILHHSVVTSSSSSSSSIIPQQSSSPSHLNDTINKIDYKFTTNNNTNIDDYNIPNTEVVTTQPSLASSVFDFDYDDNNNEEIDGVFSRIDMPDSSKSHRKHIHSTHGNTGYSSSDTYDNFCNSNDSHDYGMNNYSSKPTFIGIKSINNTDSKSTNVICTSHAYIRNKSPIPSLNENDIANIRHRQSTDSLLFNIHDSTKLSHIPSHAVMSSNSSIVSLGSRMSDNSLTSKNDVIVFEQLHDDKKEECGVREDMYKNHIDTTTTTTTTTNSHHNSKHSSYKHISQNQVTYHLSNDDHYTSQRTDNHSHSHTSHNDTHINHDNYSHIFNENSVYTPYMGYGGSSHYLPPVHHTSTAGGSSTVVSALSSQHDPPIITMTDSYTGKGSISSHPDYIHSSSTSDRHNNVNLTHIDTMNKNTTTHNMSTISSHPIPSILKTNSHLSVSPLHDMRGKQLLDSWKNSSSSITADLTDMNKNAQHFIISHRHSCDSYDNYSPRNTTTISNGIKDHYYSMDDLDFNNKSGTNNTFGNTINLITGSSKNISPHRVNPYRTETNKAHVSSSSQPSLLLSSSTHNHSHSHIQIKYDDTPIVQNNQDIYNNDTTNNTTNNNRSQSVVKSNNTMTMMMNQTELKLIPLSSTNLTSTLNKNDTKNKTATYSTTTNNNNNYMAPTKTSNKTNDNYNTTANRSGSGSNNTLSLDTSLSPLIPPTKDTKDAVYTPTASSPDKLSIKSNTSSHKRKSPRDLIIQSIPTLDITHMNISDNTTTTTNVITNKSANSATTPTNMYNTGNKNNMNNNILSSLPVPHSVNSSHSVHSIPSITIPHPQSTYSAPNSNNSSNNSHTHGNHNNNNNNGANYQTPLLSGGPYTHTNYQSHLTMTSLGGIESRSHSFISMTARSENSAETCFWDHISTEVGVVLFVYFINKIGQEMVVSSVPTLCSSMFGWTSQIEGFFMAIMGALVLPGSVIVGRLGEGVQDKTLIQQLSYLSLFSIVFILNTTLWSYSLVQYAFGSTLLFSFLNTLEGIMMALLSKLVSPKLARGTFNSGLLSTEAGTIGRVVGDMTITALSTTWISPSIYSTNNPTTVFTLVNALYIPLAGALLISIILVSIYSHKLIVNDD